jgi:hypothetical protein
MGLIRVLFAIILVAPLYLPSLAHAENYEGNWRSTITKCAGNDALGDSYIILGITNPFRIGDVLRASGDRGKNWSTAMVDDVVRGYVVPGNTIPCDTSTTLNYSAKASLPVKSGVISADINASLQAAKTVTMSGNWAMDTLDEHKTDIYLRPVNAWTPYNRYRGKAVGRNF